MKTIFITLLTICIVHFAYSQNPESIAHLDSIVITKIKKQIPQSDLLKIGVIKVLGKHLDIKLLLNTPKNISYIMSASVVINMNGEIDTVYFSEKMSDDLKKIIKPGPELISKLKNIPKRFPDFRGKIAVFPILFKRSEDASLDYRSFFETSFEGLWPAFDYKDQKKQIVLLSPYINRFSIIYN
nr:hypothetical protein [uncultured Pedobacter sp.]